MSLQGVFLCPFRPCCLFISPLASWGYSPAPQPCLSQRFPRPAHTSRKSLCRSDAGPVRQRGHHGSGQAPNDQRSRGHSNILSGGNSMCDGQAQRRRTGRLRLGCASSGIGGRSSRSNPRLRSRVQSDRVKRVGAQRIVRHLWRMCFALLIAAVSFFPGQVRLFPASVRAIKTLYAPHFLLIALLIFWVFRVRFGEAYQRKVVPAPSSP
jgi:hypothetical protein